MRATVLSFSGRDFQRHRIPALLQAGKTTKEKGQWIACHGDQGTPFYDLHVYCVSFSSSHPPASSFLDLLGTLKHKPSQASDLQIFLKKTCGHASFFSVFFILMPITLPILQLIIIAFIAHSVRMVNLSWHRWQTSQSGWHSIRPETHIAGIGRVQTCGDWTEGMEGLCLLNGFDHTSGFIFLCWVSEYHPTGCVTLVFIISFGRFGRL